MLREISKKSKKEILLEIYRRLNKFAADNAIALVLGIVLIFMMGGREAAAQGVSAEDCQGLDVMKTLVVLEPNVKNVERYKALEKACLNLGDIKKSELKKADPIKPLVKKLCPITQVREGKDGLDELLICSGYPMTRLITKYEEISKKADKAWPFLLAVDAVSPIMGKSLEKYKADPEFKEFKKILENKSPAHIKDLDELQLQITKIKEMPELLALMDFMKKEAYVNALSLGMGEGMFSQEGKGLAEVAINWIEGCQGDTNLKAGVANG